MYNLLPCAEQQFEQAQSACNSCKQSELLRRAHSTSIDEYVKEYREPVSSTRDNTSSFCDWCRPSRTAMNAPYQL
jgi:hypothetical protein